MTSATLSYQGKRVLCPVPIKSSSFDNLNEFGAQVEKQDLDVVIVTPEAWQKLEDIQNKLLGEL